MRYIPRGIQFAAPVTQEPARRTPTETHQLIHQTELQLGRHLVVQRLDLAEPVRQMEDVAHDDIGSGHIGGAHARRLVQPLNEGDAHVVDQIVGDLGTDDLALEAVLQHGTTEAFDQLLRECGFHLPREVVIVRHTGIQQRLLELDLAVGDQHRQLRTGQPLADIGALGERLVRRQELQRAIELSGSLQRIDQPHVLGGPLTGAMLRLGQCLGLLVVVLQHQIRHRIGHIEQQLVALLGCHVPRADNLV